MIEAGYYSFFSWNGYGTPTDFVGLRNYEQVLGQRIFHSALWHNVLVIVVSLLIQLPLAMAMALIVAEKIPGNNVFRTSSSQFPTPSLHWVKCFQKSPPEPRGRQLPKEAMRPTILHTKILIYSPPVV